MASGGGGGGCRGDRMGEWVWNIMCLSPFVSQLFNPNTEVRRLSLLSLVTVD